MAKKKTKIIAAVVAVAACAALTVGYMSTAGAANSEDTDALLREYPVSRGDITAGIDGAGSLALDGMPHNFKQNVKIAELFVKAGDSVKKGDKLAKLDEDALEQKLAELQTNLKKAQIGLDDAKNNMDIGKVDARDTGDASGAEYENSRSQAQANADGIANSISALSARQTELEGLIAELTAKISALDAQIAALPEDDPQRAVLKQERDALAATHAGYCEEHDGIAPKIAELNGQLGSANSGIESMERSHAQQQAVKDRERAKQRDSNALKQNTYENAIESAQVEVDDIERQIRELGEAKKEVYLLAERDGIVLELGYTEGMETNGEKALAVIGAPEDIFAKLQVAQADIGSVEEGQEVELNFDAFPDRKFIGKVTKKLPLPVKDSNPVTYVVQTSVDMEGESLLTGMTCNARFIAKQVKDVLMLSNKAIKTSNGTQVVQMKDGEGKLFEQPIKTGFSDGKYSEILSGLKEGDIVFVEG